MKTTPGGVSIPAAGRGASARILGWRGRAARAGRSGGRSVCGRASAAAAFVPAEDVAELCAFLSSDAAGHMTGVSVPIDGAWTAQ